MSLFVEPALIEPTILHDYPLELSPFARLTDDDPSIVERFEYFVGGMELGNAFTEINDSDEQAARFAQQAEEAEASPVTRTTWRRSRTACRRRGLGLGIDRLAMVLTGRETIRDVMLFPARPVRARGSRASPRRRRASRKVRDRAAVVVVVRNPLDRLDLLRRGHGVVPSERRTTPYTLISPSCCAT